MIDKKYKDFNIVALSQIDVQIAHYDWLRTNRQTILWTKVAYEVKNNPSKYKFVNQKDEYDPITRIFLEWNLTSTIVLKAT